MPFFLRAKRLDFSTGGEHAIIVLQEDEGRNFGILPGDHVELTWRGARRGLIVTANYTRSKVRRGEVGLFREVWKGRRIRDDQPLALSLLDRPPSIRAIRTKLLGRRLTADEIGSVIRDIVSGRLGTEEITYFVASGFIRDWSNDELYALTKAIAETGSTIRFPGRIVADKHSVGGLTGNRTTMIVVPIVASYGVMIPKTSSRAITSASGTADTMEVLAPVTFPLEHIRKIVQKTHACIVWGGSLNLAPADDRIIRVSYPLSIEPYSKMIVSILAKKVAMGVTHLVIDMPYGRTAKIPDRKTADEIAAKFSLLARRFGIRLTVVMDEALEPIGRGVGPALEARDVLRVLQQKAWRPPDLEEKSVRLAGTLLELTGRCRSGEGRILARDSLRSGRAWKAMQAIIRAQGGQPTIDAEAILTGARRFRVHADRAGRIVQVDTKAIDELSRILGAPHDQLAGMYVDRRIGDRVRRGERLYTLYASQPDRLGLAEAALERVQPIAIRSGTSLNAGRLTAIN